MRVSNIGYHSSEPRQNSKFGLPQNSVCHKIRFSTKFGLPQNLICHQIKFVSKKSRELQKIGFLVKREAVENRLYHITKCSIKFKTESQICKNILTVITHHITDGPVDSIRSVFNMNYV